MGFIIVIVLIGFFIQLAAADKRKTDSQWRRAADEPGLEAHIAGFMSRPRITGNMGNIRLHVRTVKKGKNSVYTVYSTQFPAQTPPFRLGREHLLSGLARVFGAQDVTVGDTAFDETFMVKAADPDALRAFMTPNRRAHLAAYAARRSVAITESSVEATFRGSQDHTDKIVSNVRRIVSLSEHLTYDDAYHQQEDEALTLREAGELAAGARELHAVGRKHPSDYGVRLAEIEALVVAERVEEAAAEVLALRVDLPDDDELAGWQREVEAVRSSLTEQPRATLLPEDAPADEIIQDLFGTTKLSFETAERFRLHHRNQLIDWQGTVRSSRDYTSDYDFGDEPGVKAVVTIAEVTHDLYGNSRIDAVLQLPAETTLKRDDVITFTGRLVKVDPLMRNIYVADGQLVED